MRFQVFLYQWILRRFTDNLNSKHQRTFQEAATRKEREEKLRNKGRQTKLPFKKTEKAMKYGPDSPDHVTKLNALIIFKTSSLNHSLFHRRQ
jgi:hypothetical protein